MIHRLAFGPAALAAALLMAGSAQAGPYAQLSSSQNQLGATAPQVVTLNQNDAVKGIANSKGEVTFKEAGAYFVMAAAQVGSATGKGKGSVRLWFRKNGRDLANSNTEQTIVPGFTAVLVCQGVEEFKAGEKLAAVFAVSAAGESLGLIASQPSGEPVVPSVIFTAFKVDGTAYAQLSSSQTQPAAAAAKPIVLDSTDGAKNIENQGGRLTFKTPGTYFVMAAGQAGSTATDGAMAGGKGRLRIWMRQNGQDSSNSNSEQTVSPGSTAVLACQGVLACNAGDTVQLVQAASGSGVGLVATAPAGEPTVPSALVSIIKVADDAYAQLSSLQSQPGSPYGQVVALDQTDAARNVENAAGRMSIALNKQTITIRQNGVYFVMAAAQVGSTDAKGSGSVRLWFRQNGIDIGKSNTEQTIPSGYTAVLVSQGVGEAKQGDLLQIFQSARGNGVGLITATPKGEPAVPSLIFSLVKVD